MAVPKGIVLKTIKEVEYWRPTYETTNEEMREMGFIFDYEALSRDWEENYAEPDWYVED